MDRRNTRISRSGLLCLAAFALLIAPAVLAQGECGELDGVEHCALGEASLHFTGGLIMVENVDMRLDGGVAANFSEGLSWSSNLAIEENDAGDTQLVASARSEGAVASTLSLRRNDDGDLDVSSTLSGGVEGLTYSVMVYSGGVFQGGQGGVGAGSSAFLIFNRDNEDFIMWLISQMGFFLRIHDGGCGWELDLGEERELLLANGEVVRGDQIQLMEEVKGDSHYAYTGFDGIDLVGSFRTLQLSSTTVLP